MDARARLLRHYLACDIRNDEQTREPAVQALYDEKLIEAYECGVSRAPYQISEKGKKLALAVPLDGPSAAELRAYFLDAITTAHKKQPGHPTGYPWFHDIEAEAMLEDGLLTVNTETKKRFAPFRLTDAGREAAAAKGGA